MAATLPTIPEPSELAKYSDQLSAYQAELRQILARPLSGMTAGAARDLDTRVKHCISDYDTVTRPMATALDRAHRRITSLRAGLVAIRTEAKRVIGRDEVRQAQENERKRLENERQAQEAAKAQRQAELEALLDEAANSTAEAGELILAEAEALEQAPLKVVLVPEIEPRKNPDFSTRFKKTGNLADPIAFVRWLVETDDRAASWSDVLEFKMSGIEQMLARGLRPPGVENVHDEPIVSNRGK
jgi:predicted ribosome quality control (RQC) complex YloA/Tae2 family protein